MFAHASSEFAVITCEILAPRTAQATALAEVAAVCANDVGQAIEPKICCTGSGTAPVITLLLPAAIAASQHQIWCLACRLACFCPDARVSVLVHGEASFNKTQSHAIDQRHSA